MKRWRRTIVALVPVAAALGLWACGGATVVVDDASASADSGSPPPDGTTLDARTDSAPRDGAACVNAEIGTACSPGDRPCGNVDGCCLGFVVMCDATSNTWKKAGVGCPCRTIPCGASMCPGTQFCRVRSPGIRFPDGAVPPDSYECTDFPDACKNDWTCGCLMNLPSSPACLSNPPGAPCTMENERPLQRCMGQ